MTFSAVLRALGARLGAGGMVLFALALGCQSDERPIGGETHFLVCESDSECRELSDRHLCIDDICQLPEPLPLLDAAAPDAGGCGQGSVPAPETVLLGDSFFATSGEIGVQLSELALQAGVLEPEQRYRDYSRLVANALALGGNGIAAQYDEALLEGAVGAVIMNGGGSDVLIGTCDTVSAECPLLTDAASAAAELFQRMSQEGVREVLYVFYPDPTDLEVRAEMDALRPLIQEACEQAPLPCHFVDLREVFDGRYAEFIQVDGLNPTVAGATATAQEIWRVMRESCLVP
jgi:hypothetical protein